VAWVVAADPDGSSAGEPVLLSTFLPGPPVGEVLRRSTEPTAGELGRSVGITLGRIGSVSFAGPGFFTDGGLQPGPAGAEPTSGLDAFVDRCLDHGNAAGHLSDAEQRNLRRFAEQTAPELAVLEGSHQLVHADFYPKYICSPPGATAGGRWSRCSTGSSHSAAHRCSTSATCCETRAPAASWRDSSTGSATAVGTCRRTGGGSARPSTFTPSPTCSVKGCRVRGSPSFMPLDIKNRSGSGVHLPARYP
jgi:hypothetical protein